MTGLRLWPSTFRGRLFVIFLLVMALPLSLIFTALIVTQTSSLRDETFAQLRFVTDAKQAEIAQYLEFSVRQAESLTKSNTVRYSIGDFYGFSHGFRMIDGNPDVARRTLQEIFAEGDAFDPAGQMGGPLLRQALDYANAHNRFHEDFVSFVRDSEFDNVYLINRDGRVVYSAGKDAYLGADLTGTLASPTPLGLLANIILSTTTRSDTILKDFAFDPVTGAFTAYVAVPVEFHNRKRGIAVFRLPADAVGAVVQGQFGNQAAGQLYLTNAAGRAISGPPGEPWRLGEKRPETAEKAVPRGPESASYETDSALIASAELPFGPQRWRLAAEVPTSQAFAKIEALTGLVLILAGLSLPMIFWTALMLSRTVASSLGKLTDVAEAIAAGNLDLDVPNLRGPAELRRLTASFGRMRSALLEQLALVREKNAELEQQVAIIADKNAELEEADRQKDAFVANTSHELRTPLNGIIGISGTLATGAAGELTPAQRGQMEIITYSARRLSRLVDDLLDLYRIRQGRMRLDIHAVHLPTSIRNVLSLAQTLVWGEAVAIKVELEDELPFLKADPVRLEQILYNLLGNAIKYAGNGDIWISARALDGEIEIAVHDKGVGIAPDNLERVFQPLERASTEMEGFGLGLTIARQMAQAMNGRLSAASTLGEGSTFRLVLPMADAETERVPMELLAERASGPIVLGAPEPAEDKSQDDRMHVLVVDDEPVNIQVLRNVLVPLGYFVEAARNGHEALELVGRNRPNLVILDVMMPGMSGFEVARRLRERHSLYQLPIIMLTARSRTRDLLAGFESGANDYVCKPFVKDELLARISTLLAASQAQRQAKENVELREEIERRALVEDALRLSQQRMSRLLDTVAPGVICATDAGRVIFRNRAASDLLGMDIRAGESQIDQILPPALMRSIREDIRLAGEANLTDVVLPASAGEALMISGFELEPQAGGGIALVLDRDSAAARSAASTLNRSIRDVLDTVGSRLAPPPDMEGGETAADTDPEGYRRTMVAVMTESLRLWRAATGSSKYELAEQSGIWRVTLDRSSLQSRTLDKYLVLETLPSQPRWRDVVGTAEFVMGRLPETVDSAALATHLDLLKQLIRKERQAGERLRGAERQDKKLSEDRAQPD